MTNPTSSTADKAAKVHSTGGYLGEAPKPLKLPNYNNCLACTAFIQINIAPPHTITAKDFDKIYSVTHEEQEYYLKLVDISLLTYDQINACSHITLPATGMEAHEWRRWWMDKHPNTKPETKMAVYYYKKL